MEKSTFDLIKHMNFEELQKHCVEMIDDRCYLNREIESLNHRLTKVTQENLKNKELIKQQKDSLHEMNETLKDLTGAV